MEGQSIPKVIFTGGHHNSALAVANELISRDIAEVVWFGHTHTMKGDTSISAEYTEVTGSKIKFRELRSGKLYRTFNPIEWLKLPYGFLQAFWYLLLERPKLVFSFGGYLAAPVVVAAWIQGIPIITHEQTTVVGLANRLISLFADKIFITWPQSKKYFSPEKVIITGLPLRDEIFTKDESEPPFFDTALPTLYITGGKQGSHVINMAVSEIIPELLTIFNVIHQCGSSTVTKDYEMLLAKREQLSDELQKRYLVREYVFLDQIGKVFAESSMLISRAGAHTVYEVAALGIPTLFIPISWVSHNEQYKNARVLVNEGMASILPENRLDSATLLTEITNMKEKLAEYQSNSQAAKRNIISNAKERIVDEVETFLAEKR